MKWSGKSFGHPSDLPQSDGHTGLWSEGSRSWLLTVRCVASSPTHCLAHPTKDHQDGSKAAHAEDSPARGQVKTDVLSLLKTVTHENLPNLRHFAFPLATSSAWNHKCVGGMLVAPWPCFRNQRDDLAIGRASENLDSRASHEPLDFEKVTLEACCLSFFICKTKRLYQNILWSLFALQSTVSKRQDELSAV